MEDRQRDRDRQRERERQREGERGRVKKTFVESVDL